MCGSGHGLLRPYQLWRCYFVRWKENIGPSFKIGHIMKSVTGGEIGVPCGQCGGAVWIDLSFFFGS